MRVLNVSFADDGGGAFRAAHRVHSALRASNVHSQMLVRKRLTTDPSVRRIRERNDLGGVLRPAIEAQLQRLQRTSSTVLHSSNLLPTRVSRVINDIDADVVNLHWMGNGLLSIEDVGRIQQPLVLRLDDMWAFCGSEHLADTSPLARWRHGYPPGRRPEGDSGLDLDRFTWLRKHRTWKRMHCICPSTWLAGLARESALLQGWPIHVVPNALDVGRFREVNRAFAREILGVPQDARVVLFGALPRDFTPNKGFDVLVAALTRMSSGVPNALAVVIGRDKPVSDGSFPVPFHWLGWLRDDITLSMAYSAADIVVMPSRQEAFGQIASEAHACGVPVVAFGGTGIDDVVVHRETGYLAFPGSDEDLARGIEWILNDEPLRQRMRVNARQRAERLWAYSVVANQLTTIYQAAIDDRRLGATTVRTFGATS